MTAGEIKCAVCGEALEAARPFGAYCSRSCRVAGAMGVRSVVRVPVAAAVEAGDLCAITDDGRAYPADPRKLLDQVEGLEKALRAERLGRLSATRAWVRVHNQNRVLRRLAGNLARKLYAKKETGS